jgi:protoheme IX farnesyltransferase
MALGGVGLAPGRANFFTLVCSLLGTALSVGSANALNMYWEREGDKLMKRTRGRPLPSGRISANSALVFGVLIGILSIVILALFVNITTALLGVFALVSYVGIYTPMKRRSPLALLIGAVPGAIPPLMGWTTVTNSIDSPGLVLFLILLVWQIPHFLAIALYHKADYAAAGIKTVPVVRGDYNAKVQAFVYSLSLIPISLLLVPLGVASWIYFSVALVLGVWFTLLSLKGFKSEQNSKWARSFFLASLVYLPVLTLGLMIDMVLK